MRRTYKYRIYPTKPQIEFLEGQLREACELYNAAKEERLSAWNTCRKSITFYDQDRQIKPMRADGCLKMVNFSSARDVLRRVDNAFSFFFSRIKRGEKGGFPRWKAVQRYDSITYTYGDGSKLIGDRIRIQGAGHIRIKLHRPVQGKTKTLMIRRDAGKWFACFNVECNATPLPVSEEEIGIDLGLKSFAALSDGTRISNPRFHKKALKGIRRIQRMVARRKKGSARRHKAAERLRALHAHVRNQRADFTHKISTKIVAKYGLIAVEDLNINPMTASMLARPISDAGWAQFLFKLSYKAESAGRKVACVNPFGTSQTCLCGARVAKSMRDRWHHCSACGLSADRDHVSAQVILQRARNSPSGANVAVVNACVA